MQELYFTLSIEGWWFVLNTPQVAYLELHLGVLIGIALIVFGIKLFKRSRQQVKLDNSLALLGAVYPKQPGKKEHGPAFYKRRGKRL